MKVEVRSSQKCCASCFFWDGERELKPNSYGMIFIVEDFRDVRTVGMCTCARSTFVSRNMPANNVICNCYQKWHALK